MNYPGAGSSAPTKDISGQPEYFDALMLAANASHEADGRDVPFFIFLSGPPLIAGSGHQSVMEACMEVDELKANVNREITALRQDLQDLKRCQLQYFTLAIMSTGAILGLSAILGEDLKGLALLAPLAVILPVSVIFFDKATTITRIVGYQMLLEKQVCAQTQIIDYKGYENALGKFRIKEAEAWQAIHQDLRSVRPSLWTVIFLKTRHRFWMINWYTFTALSLICCSGAYNLLSRNCVDLFLPFGVHILAPERTMWAGSAFVLVAICSTYTLWLIFSLTHGGLSYRACAMKWEYILKFNSTRSPDISPRASA